MKNILIGFAASVAVVSLSASAFACPQRSAANDTSNGQGIIVLAQASGGNSSTGGSGKNNTVEEQTGKATSDAPGSLDPDDVQTGETTGSIAPSVPDDRAPSATGSHDTNAVNPTVK